MVMTAFTNPGLQTINELDQWLTANCFADTYGIAGRNIYEGYGLCKIGEQFAWYYTERGQQSYLHYFSDEAAAVAFAFTKITADKFAQSHLVGLVHNQADELALIAELSARNIDYWTDRIPYHGGGKLSTRIFVMGCRVKEVLDLQDRYGIN